MRIHVDYITGPVLGEELLKRCGDEGSEQRSKLDDAGYTTLRFLQTAISFLPEAMADGADLRNTAFIFAQPGREFIIISGNGDWEFYFEQSNDGNVYGRCKRMPLRWYIWDKVTCAVTWVFEKLSSPFIAALTTTVVTEALIGSK